MSPTRCLMPICLLILLSACGSGDQDSDAPRKSSEPAVVNGQPAPTTQVQPAPAVTPDSRTPEPAAPAISAKPPAPAKPAAAPASKTPTKAKQEKPAEKLAKAPPRSKLDLSLPPELAASLEPESKLLDDAMVPILPAFFEEKKSSLNPFQMSGKLLTGPNGDDYWDSVEGAELQFEFRR